MADHEENPVSCENEDYAIPQKKGPKKDDPGDFYFKKYSAINNHNDDRFMKQVRAMNPPSMQWIAMEKVHGSHFSLVVRAFETDDGKVYKVRAAKRTNFLENDDVFSNFQEVLERYTPNAIAAFKYVEENSLSHVKPLLQLSIHGELFGGVYPHKDVERIPRAKAVQKGLYYTNHNDFYAFDLHDGHGGRYLDHDVCQEVFKHAKFISAEPLHVGTLEEIEKLDNTFESLIAEKVYKLPRLQGNVAEGYVFKPTKTAYLPNGSRVIIKSKAEKFREVDGSIKPRKPKVQKAPKEEKPITAEVEMVWEVLCTYVTENRLNNVESKGFDGVKCIGPLAEDALEEFVRSHNDEKIISIYMNLDAENVKRVKKLLGSACRDLVLKKK